MTPDLLTFCLGDSRWLIDNDYRNVLYLGWEDDDKSAAFDGFLRFWSFIITLQVGVNLNVFDCPCWFTTVFGGCYYG